MIYHGVQPRKKDKRDYSYFRTFHKDVVAMPQLGSVILSQIPDEFNFDAGLTMPDQDSDGLYNACTAYCHSDIYTDETNKLGDPKTLYQKTMEVMGISPSDPRYLKAPCDIRNALKAAKLLYKFPDYFDIIDGAPFDAFDTIRMVMWSQKRTASVGTPWLKEWERPQNGIIPEGFVSNQSSVWHDYKFCGTKKIDGVLYLIAKTWQGRNFGDNGLVYFPRSTVNNAIAMRGAFAYTFVPPENVLGDVATVKSLWWQELLKGVVLFIQSLSKPMPIPEPVEVHPTACGQAKPLPTLLDRFCMAICTYEGGTTPGDLAFRNNNPFDLRLPKGGSITAWGAIAKDSQNFLIFKTWQDGYNAGKQMITRDASGKSKIYSAEMSLLDFFRKYAPSGDGNDPDRYCNWVCQHVQEVNPFTQLKDLLK